MPWKAVAFKILPQVVTIILNWLGAKLKSKKHEERQKKRDEAHSDPADAFNEHFSGRVHNDTEPDADKANKADSGDADKS